MDKPDKQSIENQLKSIIFDRLDIKLENIKSDSHIKNDLGIDSFGAVELIFEIKDKFGIIIEDRELKSLGTIKDIVNLIFNKNKEDW